MNTPKLKRYDVKALLRCPEIRRWMLANSTLITMRREGIDITMAEALASYDAVMAEKKLDSLRRR